MKRLLLLTLLAVSCARTGLDDDDAGIDAGIDAGVTVDAGVPQCQTANDCPPTTTSPVCFAGQTAQHSCVAGRCVFDCERSRTCTTADAGCLSCAGEACSTCQNFDAPPNTGRISRSCGEAQTLIGGFTFTSLSSQVLHHAADHRRRHHRANRWARRRLSRGARFDLHPSRARHRAQTASSWGCAECTYLLEWP